MLKFSWVCAVLAVIGVSGCAGQVRPEMSSEEYTKFAKGFLIVDFCGWKGWMSPDTAALGRRYIQNDAGTYSTDIGRLNAEIKRIRENEPAPEQGECNRMSIAIKERQQSIVIYNQAVEQSQQETQELINSTRIRNTYCNRIGTQMMCNTY